MRCLQESSGTPTAVEVGAAAPGISRTRARHHVYSSWKNLMEFFEMVNRNNVLEGAYFRKPQTQNMGQCAHGLDA